LILIITESADKKSSSVVSHAAELFLLVLRGYIDIDNLTLSSASCTEAVNVTVQKANKEIYSLVMLIMHSRIPADLLLSSGTYTFSLLKYSVLETSSIQLIITN
jgi:hypothetical protein